MDEVIDVQCEKTALTRRIAADIKEILVLQPRFDQRAGKRPFALLAQPRFKAAYDFLLLRVEAGEIDAELGDWWTRFLHADEAERNEMMMPDTAKKPRRRRRKAGSKPSDAGGAPRPATDSE